MIDGDTQLSIVQMEIERQLSELKKAKEHPKIRNVPTLIEKSEEWYNELSELNNMLIEYNESKSKRWLKRKYARVKLVTKITNKMRILKKKRDKNIENMINEILESD